MLFILASIPLFGVFQTVFRVDLKIVRGQFLGKDPKGPHKRGIHDQGGFWKFPLETTVSFALK